MDSATAYVLGLCALFVGGPLFCAGTIWGVGTVLNWVRMHGGLLAIAAVALLAWILIGVLGKAFGMGGK